MIGFLIQLLTQLVMLTAQVIAMLGALLARLILAVGKLVFARGRDAWRGFQETSRARETSQGPAAVSAPMDDTVRPRRLRPKPPR